MRGCVPPTAVRRSPPPTSHGGAHRPSSRPSRWLGERPTSRSLTRWRRGGARTNCSGNNKVTGAPALGYRDDLWRQVARALVNQCGRIVIDDTNISDVIRNTLDRSDLPNDLQQRIDRRRDYAAPGALRSSIVAAAERDAVPVTVVSAAGLSRIHAGCGYENALDRRPRQRLIVCGGCGRTYDPDLRRPC